MTRRPLEPRADGIDWRPAEAGPDGVLDQMDARGIVSQHGDKPIQRHLLEGLPIAVRRGPAGKVLGLDPKARGIHAEAVEMLGRRLWAVASGLMPDRVLDEALADALLANQYEWNDPKVMDCIARMGLDPVRTLGLAFSFPNVMIRMPEERSIEVIQPLGSSTNMQTWVTIAPSIRITRQHVVLPRLSETVAMALPGRFLSEVLSHPDLDAYPLRILNAVGGEMFEQETTSIMFHDEGSGRISVSNRELAHELLGIVTDWTPTPREGPFRRTFSKIADALRHLTGRGW